MNWRRGLFRVWVVATAFWLLGSIWWLAHEASETHQLLVEMNCSVFKMSDSEFSKCWEKYRGPSEGDTWLAEGLREGNWLIIFAPPILILVVGIIFIWIVIWVMRVKPSAAIWTVEQREGPGW